MNGKSTRLPRRGRGHGIAGAADQGRKPCAYGGRQNNTWSALDPIVRKHVADDANVHIDALASYNKLQTEYVHKVIDHALGVCQRNVHTNGCENYCSVLKCTLCGTYVSVEP